MSIVTDKQKWVSTLSINVQKGYLNHLFEQTSKFMRKMSSGMGTFMPATPKLMHNSPIRVIRHKSVRFNKDTI